MKKYKLAIIGYGGFGQFLHHCWSINPAVQLVAVADLKPPQPVDPQIHYYSDWRELLTDPAIDIVAIATPPASHVEIALEAIRQHKSVILEKPIAITIDSARALKTACQRSSSIVVADFMLRFNPLVRLLKSWTDSMAFGRLRRVIIENYAQDESLPVEHWFWDKQQSGGILIEHGVHFIDLVNYISGARPSEISGVRIKRNQRQEDQVLATIGYENGTIATHYHDFSRPGFFESTSQKFIFDLAEVELTGWIPLAGSVKALVNGTTVELVRNLPGFGSDGIVPIWDLKDDSRPAGWGQPANDRPAGPETVTSGGQNYAVTDQISGNFHLRQTKQEAYSQALNAVLADVIESIGNPRHRPFITIDEALLSLEIAAAAS
ncbi:MAG: Gfo/Idh/MocA family oxidoreductase [Candidatus Neomarinimicrobiota bacterium]